MVEARKGMAVGMIEVYGLVAAFAACDAGCKAANVSVEPFDRNKPANADDLAVPLVVLVKFRGDVADVQAAMEAAARAVPNAVCKHIIANPNKAMETILKINGMDRTESSS